MIGLCVCVDDAVGEAGTSDGAGAARQQGLPEGGARGGGTGAATIAQ
jgi:hypothetical protein